MRLHAAARMNEVACARKHEEAACERKHERGRPRAKMGERVYASEHA